MYYVYICMYTYIYLYIYIYINICIQGERYVHQRIVCVCSARSAQQGNPRFYATFLDESLNLTLRDCAARSHRNTMEKRIFRLFALQGALGHVFLFGERLD